LRGPIYQKQSQFQARLPAVSIRKDAAQHVEKHYAEVFLQIPFRRILLMSICADARRDVGISAH
jgi:hypothetical protein